MKTRLLFCAVVLALPCWAQDKPFNADDTLRKAGVGVYSERLREGAREGREEPEKGRGYPTYRPRYSAPLIRCYRDLSRPLTGDLICEEEK